MSIYKRGGIYWYKFMWQRQLIRASTKQGNDKVARQMEAAHRTLLAKGEVGIREKKPIPTLSDFCDTRVEPWAKATFERSSHKTWLWYRFGLRSLKSSNALSRCKLNEIGSESAAEFAAQKLADTWEVSSVNSALRALRRVLRLALDWGVLDSAPKIRFLPGEQHRERVLSPSEESRYMADAPALLAAVATVLVDTGMRPEECHALRWEHVNWSGGRNGTILVASGKTKAARRVLPMTLRVRNILETRWEAKERAQEGWVWPSKTACGHIDHSSLRAQHSKTLLKSKVSPFVIYSLRHTFLTRLGESGCDAWTLARIAGHSNIAMSQRYVHPSEDAILGAMSRLSGHNSGHSAKGECGEAASNIYVPR